jgi:hypothetical protein
MRIFRIIGWLLVAAALLMVGWEAWDWHRTGNWVVVPLGQLWFDLHKDSLLLLQPAIERYIWPPLWDPGITTVLEWPAWGVAGGLGLIFLTIGYLAGGRSGRRRLFRGTAFRRWW